MRQEIDDNFLMFLAESVFGILSSTGNLSSSNPMMWGNAFIGDLSAFDFRHWLQSQLQSQLRTFFFCLSKRRKIPKKKRNPRRVLHTPEDREKSVFCELPNSPRRCRRDSDMRERGTNLICKKRFFPYLVQWGPNVKVNGNVNVNGVNVPSAYLEFFECFVPPLCFFT